MESTLTLIILASLAIWCYRDGKRIGSRLGFRAGRQHKSRRRRTQRR